MIQSTFTYSVLYSMIKKLIFIEKINIMFYCTYYLLGGCFMKANDYDEARAKKQEKLQKAI